jgi:hypothetical protein
MIWESPPKPETLPDHEQGELFPDPVPPFDPAARWRRDIYTGKLTSTNTRDKSTNRPSVPVHKKEAHRSIP